MPRIYITGKDQETVAKAAFDLNRLEITIGRAESNDLIIPNNGMISSKHCIIRRVKGGYVLEDLNSSNGIYLNGERDEKIVLKNEKKILIGDAPLVCKFTAEEEASLSEEGLEPWEYITEEGLVELAEQKKKAASQPPPVPKPLSPTSSSHQESAASPAVRNTYEHKGSGVSVWAILACVLLGFIAGILFKHSRTYEGGNIFSDFRENVVQWAWE